MIGETTLTYQVYVAPIIAMAGKDVPPGQSRSTWSPISATLICGGHDAVLVDPLMTVEQGMAVADWVSTTGKNLTTVYVTHGHGDHWFGLGAELVSCRFSRHHIQPGGPQPEMRRVAAARDPEAARFLQGGC
jgi:glyoxylase-like metal-dependent hydrolase (beta-lactamase superfamily II)